MAGHSKWANIKHQKARTDARRAKVWTKIIRELTVAARLGGPEPADNPRLRTVWDKALAANMPKDTIERAVRRGAGGEDGANVEELTYEGYAPGGVAILVEALSDNRNRTVAEVRHVFSRNGGNLGADGSVAYLFARRGVVSFAPGANEDAVVEAALDGGAEDVALEDDGSLTVLTRWETVGDVAGALRSMGLEPIAAEVSMVPATRVPCAEEHAIAALKLIDALEELDDVQNVYSNGDFPDSVLDA
jgi:YebC/PmpR family DNA-binding regulatory protein